MNERCFVLENTAGRPALRLLFEWVRSQPAHGATVLIDALRLEPEINEA